MIASIKALFAAMSIFYSDAIPVPVSGTVGGVMFNPINYAASGTVAHEESGLVGHGGFYQFDFNPNTPPEGYTARACSFNIPPRANFAVIDLRISVESGTSGVPYLFIIGQNSTGDYEVQIPLEPFTGVVSQTTKLIEIPEGAVIFFVGFTADMVTQQSEYLVTMSTLAIISPEIPPPPYSVAAWVQQKASHE